MDTDNTQGAAEPSPASVGYARLVKRAFQDLIETVNESNRAHAISYTALIIAMMQKGIITPAEWEDARSQATHMADQRFVELRDEKNREMIAEIARLFGKKPA